MQFLLQLALFASKAIIIVLMIAIVLILFFALASKGKQKNKGKLTIKNLNKKYEENIETLLSETLSKKQFKRFLKDKKAEEKNKEKSAETTPNVYVLNFQGDIKASAVTNLSEEITAVLNVVKPADEIVLRLESPGGMVHGYGLAAAQLQRIRARNIPLTIAIDKVAASGGYMMAAIGSKILSAPFAIIGSIGVIVQMPNFNRVLKDKHIDFEMQTAGEFKRTITMFGENTDEGREKLQHEIEDIHQQFKDLISQHRKQLDITQVATGEHWLGQRALELKLVDEIMTSDDYLLERSKKANLFEVSYEIKKSFMSKFSGAANAVREKMFGLNLF